MKRLVAAGSLCALALTALAQSTGNQQVVVPASKGALATYVSPEDFARYKGSYDLSNGKTLHLTRQKTRIYARVDQQSAHELTRAGKGTFHALDGAMSMHLVLADDESVTGELSYVDELPTVAGLPPRLVKIQIASR